MNSEKWKQTLDSGVEPREDANKGVKKREGVTKDMNPLLENVNNPSKIYNDINAG